MGIESELRNRTYVKVIVLIQQEKVVIRNKSQTFLASSSQKKKHSTFSRNATRAGSEEGRLFSQASTILKFFKQAGPDD